MLRRYGEVHPDERAVVGRFSGFVEAEPDCLLRTCKPGHITASAWIVSPDHRQFLLTHHRKLGRWLQLGGHVDGNPHVHDEALREAREESGMTRLLLVGRGDEVMPLDLDIHTIPARGSEPQHLHYDVRFLLVAPADEPLRASAESFELRWFKDGDLDSIPFEESLHRMARKASGWLAGGRRGG